MLRARLLGTRLVAAARVHNGTALGKAVGLGAAVAAAGGAGVALCRSAGDSSVELADDMSGALLFRGSLLSLPRLYGEVAVRLWRDVAAVVPIVWDYRQTIVESERLREGRPPSAELEVEVTRLWQETHQRSADRLLRLCRENRGIYIKFGQHVAQLEYLLPAEFVKTMGATLRDAPVTPIEQVREVFQEEFGVALDDVFEHFEPAPIASASLAQVRARARRAAPPALDRARAPRRCTAPRSRVVGAWRSRCSTRDCARAA